MHRFYYEDKIDLNTLITLSKEESHHAIKVLRLKIGDEIEILDGRNIFISKIVNASNSQLQAVALDIKPSVEPNAKITLFQGLAKADKLNTIVQKCTEIGIYAVIPMDMQRSIKKADNNKLQQKLKKIAIEACKQCGRNHIPIIHEVNSLKESKSLMLEMDTLLIAWEKEESAKIYDYINSKDNKYNNIGIVIGPEGGIDESEIEFFKSLGAKTISFGKRILRTETSGPCAVFAILTLLNDN